MATYYVSSVDGSDGDDGSTWALAKATVAGALAVATTDGDVILVDSAHDYQSPTAGIGWSASAGKHVSIISVNRSTGAHEAGATEEETGGNNNNFSVLGTFGSLYIEGMTLGGPPYDGPGAKIQLAATVGGRTRLEMVNCTLNVVTPTNTGAYFLIGTDGSYYSASHCKFVNCTFHIVPSATNMLVFGHVNAEFFGCTFTSDGSPTHAVSQTPMIGHVRFVGCDFSADAFSYLTGLGGDTHGSVLGLIEFVDCKVNGSTSLAPDGSWTYPEEHVRYVNCDSGDTTYEFEDHDPFAALTVDTSVYANGGAAVDGTNLSWKIVTTAACTEYWPYVTPWVAVWVDAGSKTFSMEIVSDGGDFDDRDCWMEVEYLGDASYPLGTFDSTRNAEPFDGTAVDLSAGSATWTGTGGFGAETKDKVSLSGTVNRSGYARTRLVVAKASQTLYVDPQVRVA